MYLLTYLLYDTTSGMGTLEFKQWRMSSLQCIFLQVYVLVADRVMCWLQLGFCMLESVPSCHHFKKKEYTPVDSKGFNAAVYKEVCNGNSARLNLSAYQ